MRRAVSHAALLKRLEALEQRRQTHETARAALFLRCGGEDIGPVPPPSAPGTRRPTIVVNITGALPAWDELEAHEAPAHEDVPAERELPEPLILTPAPAPPPAPSPPPRNAGPQPLLFGDNPLVVGMAGDPIETIGEALWRAERRARGDE
ncbi:hypothetical protein [Roseicella frigidaeris]|uniref:hypothetical protein n=1 Tax=Roseicella frigidaeris TaxID=2230885 RepID=UPI001401CDB1|nr:hypothetical protein [Roseicella frigidaeris]